MPSQSTTKQSIQELNALRRSAVQLRLDGHTLADTANRVGLSAPTIISAVKAYHKGGWEAVDVSGRGRPKRTSAQNDAELETLHEQLIADTLLSALSEFKDPTDSLMNIERFAQWLQDKGHPLSRSAQLALLKKWDLQPDNRYKRLRSNALDGSGVDVAGISEVSTSGKSHSNSGQWLEHHTRFATRARRAGALVLWIGSRSLVNNLTQLYAHDLRGRTHWCLVKGTAHSEHYQRLLQALATLLDQPLALVFSNTQLARVSPISQWLTETHTPFLCVDEHGSAPFFNPTPGPQMTATSQAASVARQPDNTSNTLTHLQRLEAESIHIMREVVAEAENPVMLYSIGKDSAVMLHLARKAFYPAVPPFPLLHVDTTWKFQAMYEFRENIVKEYGLELLRHTNPEGLAQNVNPFTHGSSLHTDIMKTQGLKQALDEHKFDFAFGGARRDEEKSRAKERVFSFRNAQHRWDAKNQRPELWKMYNARKQRDESIRVFPLSNWTELDIWQYIYKEEIPIVPLYLAAERPVVERDGSLIMVDDDRMPLKDGEVPEMRSVRFRTLGCYPLTGAVESTATTLEEIIQEMLLTRTSERQGRMIDHDSAASMEKKKQEGYF